MHPFLGVRPAGGPRGLSPLILAADNPNRDEDRLIHELSLLSLSEHRKRYLELALGEEQFLVMGRMLHMRDRAERGWRGPRPGSQGPDWLPLPDPRPRPIAGGGSPRHHNCRSTLSGDPGRPGAGS